MIQPAKVNFNKAMFAVVLAFGLVSTLILFSDPLKPENDEIPTIAKKTTEDMFATVDSSIARSLRPTRIPASENSNSQPGFVASNSAQASLQNPFGVNSASDGLDIDCANPPATDVAPKQTQAPRIKIQLNNCPLVGLKIINNTNGFEGLLFKLGETTAVSDLINLVDKENDLEVTGPQVSIKFKVINSLPKK